MMSLRPRRRTEVGETSATSSQNERASPDTEEVRQSAAVLEMMASKSQAQSRANVGEEEENTTLSELIASVIGNEAKQQTPQKQDQGQSQSKKQQPAEAEEYLAKRVSKRKTMYDEDPNYSPGTRGKLTKEKKQKQKPEKAKTETPKSPKVPKTPKSVSAKKATPTMTPTTKSKRGRKPKVRNEDQPLAIRGRKSKVSMEVTVTRSDDEEEETEMAAEYFGRDVPQDLLDDEYFGHEYDLAAGTHTGPPTAPAAPRYYEMTPQLLETLMAPVGLFQSLSEDGTEKELRLRMPVDFGGGCLGVCDVLFNEHLGVKIDGATDWLTVAFIGDYLDFESIQIPDSLPMELEGAITTPPPAPTRSPPAKPSPAATRTSTRSGSKAAPAAPASTASTGPQNSLLCKEEFNRIAGILHMDEWMQKYFGKRSSSWLSEHDYSEPNVKFGRPRSANVLQDAVAAFNKYVNFIRSSERREPFLFGLWWEKEDVLQDYWLLPKTELNDEELDRRHASLMIPIANEWTEEVVVSTEETVDVSGASGNVTPMTFWDNRGFLSASALSMDSIADFHSSDFAAANDQFRIPESIAARRKKRTTQTTVDRAPRFLAPKLDPETALLYVDKFNENGMPDDINDLVNTIQNTRMLISSSNNKPSASGVQPKNLSKEKLEEIDFAMRCIKELQQRRITPSGSSRLACRICTREFTAPTSLIVHYRSHAGIKPFTCPICMTAFTRRHSLKYHMLCHSGQARFKCSVCERLFRHSGHYRDHMRKHEQGMPFNCNECNRVFATRTTFRRHMAMVHQAAGYQKGKGRSVGVTKLYTDMEGMDFEAELGEVAEEIEYDGVEEDDDDMEGLVEEEII